MATLLEVEKLSTDIARRHDVVHPVDGVSFSVETGETVGLVGESGCGKTMTGMSVMRLLPPGGIIASGTIRLHGRDLAVASPAEMRKVRGEEVAMVFQDPMTSLNPTMTIGAQVAESYRLHRDASRADARARAVEVLGLVGMPRPAERLDDYPHQLSGGMRQRVMIAMALVCDPQLLIADEPTTALDVTIQDQILELLDELKGRLGMGMLLVTHDMGVIAGRADRVLVMYAGRIVESASTVELFASPRHPYTEALLASIPRLDQDRDRPLFSIPGLPPDLASPPSGCRFSPRCLYVSQRCRDEDPVLGGGDPAHPFACFHPRPLGRAPVETPVTVRQRTPVTAAPVTAAPVTAASVTAASVTAASAPSEALVGPVPPNGTAPVPLLELVDVYKEFPVTAGILQRKSGSVKAVSGVSFSVAPGETFGLVGESGCGKTTIGRLVVALERPDSGSVRFDGTDLGSLRGSALRRQRRDLQLMFQDPYASLDPRMRVGATFREPMAVQHISSRAQRDARVAELLGDVGLAAEALQRYPHEFSGGQRQRIGFARALTLSPRLIVADEPVSALDVSIQSQVLNLMKRLQASFGLTYIVISHDLAVVKYLADRIGVMYLGKLVEIGSGDDIYTRSAHPYTAGLLEAIPEPDPSRHEAKSGAALAGELPSAINPPSGCRFRTRCPRAAERCAEEEPVLRSFGPGHLAACHFPLQEPLAISLAGVHVESDATDRK